MDLLHPRVQQAIWKLRWRAFRPIQEAAIDVIMNESGDAILCAPTAGGKTEAAFLPIVSHILERGVPSIQVIWLCPLKALINDQHKRLSCLCVDLDIPVHRWHGDVSHHQKKLLRNNPRGVLILTPESLESNFINHGHLVRQMYSGLEYVVIDELHAYPNTERGMHLRSLLARLFTAIGRRPRCLGLSATLSDPEGFCGYLNPDEPGSVRILGDRTDRRPVQVHLQAFPTSTALTHIAEDAICYVVANNRSFMARRRQF